MRTPRNPRRRRPSDFSDVASETRFEEAPTDRVAQPRSVRRFWGVPVWSVLLPLLVGIGIGINFLIGFYFGFEAQRQKFDQVLKEAEQRFADDQKKVLERLQAEKDNLEKVKSDLKFICENTSAWNKQCEKYR